MNLIFHDLLEVILEVYIDDPLVKSTTFEGHLANLRLAFERIRKYNLKMNPLRPCSLKLIQPWMDLDWDPIHTAILVSSFFIRLSPFRILIQDLEYFFYYPKSESDPHLGGSGKKPSSKAVDELWRHDGDASFFPPPAAIDSLSNLLFGKTANSFIRLGSCMLGRQ
jgi:hypothetical protein